MWPLWNQLVSPDHPEITSRSPTNHRWCIDATSELTYCALTRAGNCESYLLSKGNASGGGTTIPPPESGARSQTTTRRRATSTDATTDDPGGQYDKPYRKFRADRTDCRREPLVETNCRKQ